jgi:hypothetical protein
MPNKYIDNFHNLLLDNCRPGNTKIKPFCSKYDLEGAKLKIFNFDVSNNMYTNVHKSGRCAKRRNNLRTEKMRSGTPVF